MFNLVNKVAIVTGASRGIGKAIAEAVAQAGAHVICVSRSENELIKISSLSLIHISEPTRPY